MRPTGLPDFCAVASSAWPFDDSRERGKPIAVQGREAQSDVWIAGATALAVCLAACSPGSDEEARVPSFGATGGAVSSSTGGANAGGGTTSGGSGGAPAGMGGASGVDNPPQFPRPIDVDGGSNPSDPPPVPGTGGTPGTPPPAAVCATLPLPSAPAAGTGSVSHCSPKACNGVAPDSDLSESWHQDLPAARYSGCTSVTGTVMIAMSNHVDLAELACLEHVTGDVVIWNNPGLETLHGLESLIAVDGSFQLGRRDSLSARNDSLQSVEALGGLQSVGHDLLLDFNLPLPDLDGFGALLAVGGTLAFHSRSALPSTPSKPTNVSGFGSLRSIGKDLALQAADAIPAISGLGSLTSIGGSVLVEGATDLVALSGLPSLACIGKNVSVIRSAYEENPALKSIGPFPLLRTIGGYVHVEGASNLESIDLFGTVTRLDGGTLRILDNPRLTAVSVGSLTSVGDDVTFGQNPSLSDCPLLDLETRLRAAGYSYQFTVEGGLGCPPPR
jgi:hypothetical protein